MILGRLSVLLPLLETSLVLTWDYEKAECWSRPEGFLHTECGCYMVCLSLAFLLQWKLHHQSLGWEWGVADHPPSAESQWCLSSGLWELPRIYLGLFPSLRSLDCPRTCPSGIQGRVWHASQDGKERSRMDSTGGWWRCWYNTVLLPYLCSSLKSRNMTSDFVFILKIVLWFH